MRRYLPKRFRNSIPANAKTILILVLNLFSQVNTAIEKTSRESLAVAVQYQCDGSILLTFACKTDGARTPVIIFYRTGRQPRFSGFFSNLEGGRLDVHNTFFNHESQFAFAFFQVHQRRNRNADGFPFRKILLQVLDACHLAGTPVGNQAENRQSQIIRVVTVKPGRVVSPPVITVKMGLGFELRNRLLVYLFYWRGNIIGFLNQSRLEKHLLEGFDTDNRIFHHHLR